MPAIEIIIPSRIGASLLRAQWPAVERAAGDAGATVAVVLDGPDPAAESFLADRARVVRLAVAGGFGAAVNAGVASSEADRLILLNNDVIPESLAGFLGDWKPEEFARTGSCINERFGLDESPSQWTIEDGLLRVVHPVVDGGSPPPSGSPIAHAHGGASAFDRAKWAALGGFSPLYLPAYGEDVDLSFRAWKRGWTVTFRPDARMLHRSGSTTSRMFAESDREALAERHRLLFHLACLGDPALVRSRDRAFARILSSGYLQYSRWRLKESLLWALSRSEEAAESLARLKKQSDLSDREAIVRSGADPSIFDGI